MFSQSRIVSRDLSAARRFYSTMARPLGLAILDTREDGFSLGKVSDMDHPVLQVNVVDYGDDEPETRPAHVALEAPDDVTVRAFYRAAMEAGGRQLGYPAPQPTRGYRYYSSRVVDLDGNCIECGWRH